MKLEVRDIHKSFGETEVLHGISFTANGGSALGLLGRNGAGKTTTIRILMDVFKANKGEVLLDGKKLEPRKVGIGYLPEERGLYPKKKVGEQIIYLAQLRGMNARDAKKNTKKWLARLGISEYYDRKLETLSKGNQQKTQVVQTLVTDPQIIILDELFSGLDPVNSQILKDVMTEEIAKGKIVIFSSHQMSYVEEFCDDIIILNSGEIVLSGVLHEIKKRFGNNRLVLSVNGMDKRALSGEVAAHFDTFVSVLDSNREQLILELKSGQTKAEFMRALAGRGLDIESFGDYAPSLNEIFIESAGDDQ